MCIVRTKIQCILLISHIQSKFSYTSKEVRAVYAPLECVVASFLYVNACPIENIFYVATDVLI